MYFYKVYGIFHLFPNTPDMKEKESALYSQYIIDGVRCDTTPAELLGECMEFPDFADEDSSDYDDIIDESTEPPLTLPESASDIFEDCIARLSESANQERPFSRSVGGVVDNEKLNIILSLLYLYGKGVGNAARRKAIVIELNRVRLVIKGSTDSTVSTAYQGCKHGLATVKGELNTRNGSTVIKPYGEGHRMTLGNGRLGIFIAVVKILATAVAEIVVVSIYMLLTLLAGCKTHNKCESKKNNQKFFHFISPCS